MFVNPDWLIKLVISIGAYYQFNKTSDASETCQNWAIKQENFYYLDRSKYNNIVLVYKESIKYI